MSTYIVTVRLRTGIVPIRIKASSAETAAMVVCRFTNAPAHAVQSVELLDDPPEAIL